MIDSNKLIAIFVENFLLVGFCLSVIFSLSYPFAGKLFYSWEVGDYHIIELINNCVVFFISGVTLKLEELKTVIKHNVAIIYSLVTINIITTLLSFGLIKLPYVTNDFAVGLTIFATVPTTLGVGVALTQLAKGDQILSLLLTVVSNFLGVVTVPFFLGIYLNNTKGLTVDPVLLVFKMTITVLIPSVVGIAARKYIPFVPTFTKDYKTQLSMISTSNLIMIVWMALSSARNTLLAQDIGQILFIIAIAIIQHTFYLCYNGFMTSKYLFNFPIKQAVSVIIMASQKSSPVALAIITSLTTDVPEQKGLFVLPCIIGQLTQILIGSFLAPRLAKWVDSAGSTANSSIPMTILPGNAEQKTSLPTTDDPTPILPIVVDASK